ncbi:PREDICTED: protein TANC2 isoform X2 [Vollenhovia emeryi]|uniref:protein TANC2 isoform X2 n=1 Tax=Vollenhovia emeryi TaxID=411798 RepID=UPI0005F3BA56|nr:PREDICTED: protein TANC2 isoform X2 [Vollenhovia emeryi]
MAPPDRSPRPNSGLSLSVLDLAQIRALVESTGVLGGSTCPSCEMPFDKGKKRRLIDSCGHERCYSCLFRSEVCPLCLRGYDLNDDGDDVDDDEDEDDNDDDDDDDDDRLEEPSLRDVSSAPLSIFAPTDGWLDESSTVNSLCGSPRLRTKITTRANLPSRVLHQRGAAENLSLIAVAKNLKSKATSPLSAPSVSQDRQKLKMTQSCPTPPNQRRRFFLNPKVLRSSLAVQRPSRHAVSSPEPIVHDNPSALSVGMTSSLEGKASWPGVVLGKIKSLWSSSQGTANDGLNQLIGSSNKVTDDEGGCVKPLSSKTRKSSQSDLYMRLGLLLGSNRANASMESSVHPSRTPIQGHDSSAASFSSLTSFEAQTLASTNTSPVSTLTGTSSEAEAAAAALRCSMKPKVKAKGKTKSRDCDSAGSLASISTSLSASTSMSMSMSVSVSGLSNGSSSPLAPRRHSVNAAHAGQPDELGQLKNRRSCARRSARASNVKGPLDAKLRFVQRHTTQLNLKPLFFEVPLLEQDPLFAGRQWLLHELESVINGSSPGILLSGSSGTGKTALVLQLVEHSCFGRRKEQPRSAEVSEECDETEKQNATLRANIQHTNEKVRELASHVVAYHFCQADNNSTCLVPDLIHSLAAQLCQAPQLISYREYLLSEPHLQGSLSQRECTVDPDLALSRGIIEPLSTLKKANKLPTSNMVILIDAVCEAEYHRPDRGDTIASFLTRHAPNIPSWLKIVCTVRTPLLDCAKQLPYTRISLDKTTNDAIGNSIAKDLSDYVGYRLAQSPSIQSNVTASVNGKAESSCSAYQTRFSSHLLTLARGSFLFAKLTLDLIESGHLVAKSASYKVLPVSLAQIFLLHFNLRFPTAASFDKVQPLLAVCLAALYPLTLPEIFYSVNSLNVHHFISWDDFLQRFKMLSGFLVKRLDNTYMFFHPSFREWLMRRDEGESTKFLCDYRLGHAAIAFRLSRLQAPLDGDKTLELGHHVLKAHVYRGVAPCWPSRDLQAIWLTLSTECISSALCTLRNIYSPNVKVSRLLLLAGASPNHITEYLGNAPVLCMYAHEGSVEMVSLLLEFGADVELTNSQGCTALSLAAARGHCDVVRRLAAAGASLGHVDMAGQCPLVHAARHGRLSVVGYLLACDWISENKAESGALEIDREEAAQQAVVAAASQGHEAVVEYLLDMAEVIVDRPDTLIGETALTVSAANGSTATVSALLAHGANPRAVNTKGLSPLMLAAREGHWGTAERLLQGDLSISMNTVTDESVALLEQGDLAGRTALMLAASEGHINLLELFLDKGSILETKDKEGLTALSWACVRGRVTAVQMLLDRGSDVNTNDNSGRTPLDLAAFQGNPKLVQLLLEKGAAVEHVDLHGMRPLDRAIGCRNIPVVQCFLRRGAKLGPATWAMAAGKPDVLIILLNKLLEDGNVLYRKNRLKEASHRYAYALRKFPVSPEEDCQGQEQSHMMLQLQTFTQLHLNFLLNLSRCKRKMNECTEAIELADEALSIRSVSYEAFYARAKARVDLGMFEDALSDVQEALQNAPAHNRQDRRVLATLKDEIVSWIDGAGTNKEHDGYSARSRLRASVDTLTEL